MKSIGKVADRNDADTFLAYLGSMGISSEGHTEPDGVEIWVHDLDLLEQARGQLTEFQQAGDRSSYEDAAAEYRSQQIARQKARIASRQPKRQRAFRPFADQVPVTLCLSAICAAVFMMTELSDDRSEWLGALLISNDMAAFETQSFLGVELHTTLKEVSHGEVWRLVTPIFLHFHLMHIFFNLLWLTQLGSAIEYRRGSLWYLLIVLTIAVVSNVAQFVFGGPSFGGISGVVSGLFGYVLVTGRYAPEDGIGIDSRNALLMLLYLGLCLTPVIPNVANWAHMVGLALGASIAALRIGLTRVGRRMR